MKVVAIKRLYNGYASIRDYVVNDAILNNEPVSVRCNGAEMVLTPEELRKGQRGKVFFESKFDGKRYTLVDFKWNSKQKGLFK